MKKKLVFISNMAAPYQVKFCYALQGYFDAEFWFHVHLEPDRPDWWRIELGNKCKILGKVVGKRYRKYLSLDIIKELDRWNPDLVVLGGLGLPSNIVAYHWAKLHHKQVVQFGEVTRDRRHVLRTKGLYTRFFHFLYRDIDAILTSAIEGTQQFRDVYGFGDRVVMAQYPADIDEHLKHPLREKKEAYVLLYANRLTEIYDPLSAIEIFAAVHARHPGTRLLMNSMGELLDSCRERLQELGLQAHVQFLDEIRSWNDLHQVYRASDILILPAKFSAGNFTIIESMASGMGIVISSNVLGTYAGLITSGENGFVCNPDVSEFVEAIEKYHRAPDLLTAHGRISKTLVHRYSIAQTADLWNQLLCNIGTRS